MPWQSFAYLLPVVPATVLAVSDLRRRTVPVSWLTAFGLCVLLPSVFLSSVGTILYNMLTNMLLLIWVFGGACIYLKLRYRRPSSLFRQYVGSGDLIFALLLTPLAPLPQYLLLLLGGMLGRTVLLARRACRRTERDYDSAGYVSEPASDRLFVVPFLPFAAMTLPERIPTEIVQLFASAEAWNYRLVPYDRRDGIVLCAGEQGRDYASASQEIEVLSGFRVQIEPVGPDEFSLLLNRYYRREETRPISGRTADLSRIGSGQGFLTDLIGEAFDEYASDIHFEPYEERCRIRLRIDGKLIEKYVLDRSGYASIVNQIKIMANLDISERRLPQDGRILYHRGDRKFDLRVSSLPTIYGEKVVLRLLTRHAELLELSNLGFSERQLADYESAIARPHGMALITGPTGSGKSTILSLICRNYEFQKGEILIDGIDIRKIKISSLRRHFGQMLQDVFLFSGTIRSNIVLREEGIPDEEIMQVCRYVNADKFIDKLDHGLDEEVRERGNNFSAGQRQLLSFARTIIHKPSVMILDEATANIDTETELLIQDSLEKMRSVGTMLIVAHRLSTIQHADNIIVLSHGKILEQGSHQALLAKHGRYYQLYTLQYHKEQMKG